MNQLFLQGKDIAELSDHELRWMVRQYKKIAEKSVRYWESATNKRQKDYHDGIIKDAQGLVSSGLLEQQRRGWL